MKLSEFIKKLQELEAQGCGDLPVALADWQEQYKDPAIIDADSICETEGLYYSDDEKKMLRGRFVHISA